MISTNMIQNVLLFVCHCLTSNSNKSLTLLKQTTCNTCLFSLFKMNTQATNKYTHPGLPDLPSQRQWQEQLKDSVTVEKQGVAVTKVAMIKNQLLTTQENAKANACQPAGPGITKKPHVQVSSSPNVSVRPTSEGLHMYKAAMNRRVLD